MIKEFVHLMEVRTQSQETRDGERTEADTIQCVLSTEALPSLCGSQGLDHGPRHAAAVMPSLDFRWLPALSMGHRIRLSRSLIPSWECTVEGKSLFRRSRRNGTRNPTKQWLRTSHVETTRTDSAASMGVHPMSR